MLTLLDDAELREQMAVIGRQRVEEKLAWRYSEPILLQAYDQLFATDGLKLGLAGQSD